ncbi:helix-turn-helix domain-containing protein [Rhizobium leguminosarum]|uniref:helix-turn-helix domain-containing protein n=1 Tax=Rhizobium leguminosarum TaxID=384 RepID=UPI003F9979BD
MSHSNTSPCAAVDSHFAPACFITPEPEVWRSVPGYGSLEASSHGRLRNGATGYVLKLRLNSSGYLQTGFTVNGRWRACNAHRMVCLAFHGLPPHPDDHAAHKDDDRTNCHADNMEWLSPAENWAAAERHHRCRVAAERRKAEREAVARGEAIPLEGYAKRRAESRARGEAVKAAATRDRSRILSLFNEGQTVQQIATALGRAYATVKRVITLSGNMTGAAQLEMAERLAA